MGLRRRNQQIFNELVKSIIIESDNTIICPIHINIDDYFDWGRKQVQVSQVNNQTIEYITDIVHLGTYGYYKIADMLYSYI